MRNSSRTGVAREGAPELRAALGPPRGRSGPTSVAPIRVLHVLGTLERGGVETWLLELAAGLDRRRWQFDFLTLGGLGRLAPLARAGGSEVLDCPLRAGSLWGFAHRLDRLLRAGEYQIVASHVHHFSAVVLAVARAAGIGARVAHSHNTHDGRSDTFGRRAYRAGTRWLLDRSMTAAVACSAEAAAGLFGDAPGVWVVHYGLPGSLATEADSISRERLRAELGLPAGAPVVGHVGRFDRQKNHDFLLEIAAALRLAQPEACWLLAGDGIERDRIVERARRMGLAETIRFLGLRQDVPRLLAAAVDVFAFPSLHEGLPIALLEAQAAGLRAVVSSRISREATVVAGAVEFLPLEAPAAVWAARLTARLAEGRLPPDRARRELVRAGFAIEQSRARLLGAYQRALESAGTGGRR